MGTAAGFDAGVCFINGGKGVFGVIGREEAGEPSGGALTGFGAPLGSAGFGGDLEAFDFAAVAGAAASFGHGNEGFFDGLHDFGVDGELIPEAVWVGSDDFVVESLDLFDEPGLIKISPGGESGHGLGHLQRGDEDVALPDAHIGDVPLEDAAFVHAEHVVIVGHVAGGFGFDGKAGAAS